MLSEWWCYSDRRHTLYLPRASTEQGRTAVCPATTVTLTIGTSNDGSSPRTVTHHPRLSTDNVYVRWLGWEPFVMPYRYSLTVFYNFVHNPWQLYFSFSVISFKFLQCNYTGSRTNGGCAFFVASARLTASVKDVWRWFSCRVAMYPEALNDCRKQPRSYRRERTISVFCCCCCLLYMLVVLSLYSCSIPATVHELYCQYVYVLYNLSDVYTARVCSMRSLPQAATELYIYEVL